MSIADNLSTMYDRLDLILTECNNALAYKGVVISASTLAEVPNLIRSIINAGNSTGETIYYYYGKGTNKLPLSPINLSADEGDTWSIRIEIVTQPIENELGQNIFLSGDFTVNFQTYGDNFLIGYFVNGSNITVLNSSGDTVSLGSIAFVSGETESSNILSQEGYEGGPDRHLTIENVVFPNGAQYRLTVVSTS